MNTIRRFGEPAQPRTDKPVPADHKSSSDITRSGFGLLNQTPENPGLRSAMEKLVPAPASREQNAATAIQQDFKNQFSALASNKAEFHKVVREVYGQDYDAEQAETFRQRALVGDYAWLPKIEFRSNEEPQSGNAAYDTARNVVYLNEKSLNDPEKTAQIYSQEIGRFLNMQLNTSDTVGDEGGMFRRLLGGEKLDTSEKSATSPDIDHRVIAVEVKSPEVKLSTGGDTVNAVSDGAKPAPGVMAEGTPVLSVAIVSVMQPFSGFIGSLARKVVSAVNQPLKFAATWALDAFATVQKYFSPRGSDGFKGVSEGRPESIYEPRKTTFEDTDRVIRRGKKAFKLTSVLVVWLKFLVEVPIDAALSIGERAIKAIQKGDRSRKSAPPSEPGKDQKGL